MNLKEAVLNRRSVRVYNELPVDHALVIDLLTSASYAPTHQMRESWRFILLDGDAKKQCVEDMESIFEGVPAEIAKVDYRKKVISGASSVLIVVTPKFADPKINHEEIGAAFCLVQNVQLLAHEEKLGTCIKTSLIESLLVTHLGISDAEQVVCALTMGYTEKTFTAKPRQTIQPRLTLFK